MTNFAPWLARWELIADGAPITTRMGSELLPVRQGDVPAMLKIAHEPEEIRGAEILEWYGGHGAARVLARQADALLLERLAGTESLAEMARGGRDEEATIVLCATIAELHARRTHDAPNSLIPLSEWFRALRNAAAEHGGVFAQLERLAQRLLSEPRNVVPLHGDVHHDNVLDGGARGWLAIDPKGLIGERAFDYANLFRNPDAVTALAPNRLQRHVALVSARAGIEANRLIRWVAAYAGLSAAWSLQSGHHADANTAFAIAEIALAELER